MPALETVDLNGVEIMAANVQAFGSGGAPAGGETRTVDDLRRIAAASNAVIDEARPPNKLGHNAGGTEQPALGWLSGFRVDGEKLLADVKAVPKKFADLIQAGSFRTRSPEVGAFRSQKSGKTYPE